MRKRMIVNIVLLASLTLLSAMTALAATAKVYENKATATTVTIDNNFADSTTTTGGAITFKANTFANGDTVTIIDSKKVKLGEVNITTATQEYTVNVKLTRKSGSVGVYVTPNSTDFKISKTNTIKYLAQKSPVVDAANIKIAGNADKDDILTMTGVELGDTVNVYKATATDKDKPIAKGTAKGASVEVKLGKNCISVETGIKVSITKKDCLESDRILIKDTDLDYTKPSVSADMTKVFVINSAALVSGLLPKDIINVYSADPTQYLSKYPSAADKAALKGMLLGTKAVGAKGSYVLIPFKKSLEDNATVYVTRKTPGKTVTTVMKSVAAGGGSSSPTIPTAQFVDPVTDGTTTPSLDITYHLSSGTFDPDKATNVSNWKVTKNGSDMKVDSVSLSDGNKTAYVVVDYAGIDVHNATILPDSSVFASGTAPTTPIDVQITAKPIVPSIPGVVLADAPGNVSNDYNGEGVLKNLPSLSSGYSYKYAMVPSLDGNSRSKLPKLGATVGGSQWFAVDTDTNIVDLSRAANVTAAASNVNGYLLILAEVDDGNRLVKSKVITVVGITDYQGSTHGTLTGTVAITNDYVASLNKTTDDTTTFIITVDGTPHTVTITFQDYNRGALSMKISNAGNISVDYDANDHIVLTSGSYGPESTISVSGEDAALIFGTKPIIVNGKDIG